MSPFDAFAQEDRRSTAVRHIAAAAADNLFFIFSPVYLYIKQKLYHIAVADDIVLALAAKQTL